MRTLWGTIAVMIVSTALIFGVPMLFQSDAEPRTIAMEVAPPGGDTTTAAPAAPGLVERIVETAIENVQECFWAVVQALLIGRYVKKRAA